MFFINKLADTLGNFVADILSICIVSVDTVTAEIQRCKVCQRSVGDEPETDVADPVAGKHERIQIVEVFQPGSEIVYRLTELIDDLFFSFMSLRISKQKAIRPWFLITIESATGSQKNQNP